MLLFALALRMHPMHTTVLTLNWNSRTSVLEGTLRIFDDDLRGAAMNARMTTAAYVLKNVRVLARDGRVPLTVCGERRAADAVLVCLRGPATNPSGLRVRNELLFERYDDQVNIVRVERGSATTVLFTRASPEGAVE